MSLSSSTTVAGVVGWRERLEATLNAAVDAVVIIDEEGMIESVNPAAEAMFGFSRDELLGCNVSILMPEPYANEHHRYIDNYLRGGAPKVIGVGREVLGKRRDGTVFPVEIAVGEGRYGARRFFVGQLRDISERKRLEEQLHRRQEELRQIQANAPVPTVIVDLDGQVIEANSACSSVFGYAEGECEDLSLRDVVHPEDYTATASLLAKLGRQEMDTGELALRFRHRDGQTLHGILHLGAVHDEEGRTERLVVQIVDRTEQVAAELENRENLARLAHVHRLSSLGEMAAGIAHEVNQPLGAISNYAQACRMLLETGRGEPQRLGEILDKISAQAQRAGEVIRRLRTLARGREAGRNLIDVNHLVRDVVKLGELDARLEGVGIDLDLADDALPSAVADFVQIQQVILNLLRNGMEAMREAHTREPRLLVRTRLLADDEIEVSVCDRGAGIDPQVTNEIMSPFFSTKESGMGMGLAICQSIVAAHGGRLWFTANQGPGTTFHFTVPAEPAGNGNE